MDKLTIEDCEKAIDALGTSQMKDSLMARSLMGMHQQLADIMRENARLRSCLLDLRGRKNFMSRS